MKGTFRMIRRDAQGKLIIPKSGQRCEGCVGTEVAKECPAEYGCDLYPGGDGFRQDREKKVVKRLLVAGVIVKRQGVAYMAKLDLGRICRACGRIVEEGRAIRICAKCQAAAEAVKEGK